VLRPQQGVSWATDNMSSVRVRDIRTSASRRRGMTPVRTACDATSDGAVDVPTTALKPSQVPQVGISLYGNSEEEEEEERSSSSSFLACRNTSGQPTAVEPLEFHPTGYERASLGRSCSDD
jgi:hypothetical protein